jgi:hypothetical protein
LNPPYIHSKMDAGGVILRYSDTKVYALAMIVHLARLDAAPFGMALFLGNDLRMAYATISKLIVT